jgi:hypothetical protein
VVQVEYHVHKVLEYPHLFPFSRTSHQKAMIVHSTSTDVHVLCAKLSTERHNKEKNGSARKHNGVKHEGEKKRDTSAAT